MGLGSILLIALLLFLTVAFAASAVKGLKGERLWLPLPDDGMDVSPGPEEVPPRYRRFAGAVFLALALGSLAYIVVLIARLVR